MYKTIKSLFLVFALIICMGASPSGSPVGGVSGSPADLPSLVRDLLDDGVINQSNVSSSYTGFKIKIEHTDWIGLYEVRIEDSEGSEFFTALTHKDENTSNTFAAIAAGETQTNSVYGAVTSWSANIADNKPDITIAGNIPGSPQWNDSSGADLWVYVKPSEAKTIGAVYLAISTDYGDASANATVTVYDQDDNIITQTGINRAYQTAAGNVKWIEVSF